MGSVFRKTVRRPLPEGAEAGINIEAANKLAVYFGLTLEPATQTKRPRKGK